MARTVLDASALIAALTAEPAQTEVEALLRDQPPPVISAVNLAEVFDRLIRLGGWSATLVRRQVNLLLAGGLSVEPVWVGAARLAGNLRAEHYERNARPLSLADCICVATAIGGRMRLATTDGVVAATARAVGVTVVPLPNSLGERP